MSLAETRHVPEYNDAACRKWLSKAIDAHQTKLAELAELRAAVKEAEAKLLAMKEAIDQSAHVEDAATEAVAEALRCGKEVSEHSPAWKAKQTRDALIAEHSLLTRGLTRLQARASGLELQVAAEYAELLRVREPLIQNVLENLADELAQKESESAAMRARLFGFSVCSTGPVPQKLPPLALTLLRSAPKNATPPQMNTPEHHMMNRDKQSFIAWKKALETDASAALDL